MEVGQQEGARGRVGAGNGVLLLGDVAAQLADHALHRAAGLAQDAGLDDAARREGVLRLLGRGLDHVPAAPGLHLHEAARLQLHQRLAHHGAADREVVGQLLLPQPFAGRQFLGQDGFDDALGDVLGAYRCHCVAGWAGVTVAGTAAAPEGSASGP